MRETTTSQIIDDVRAFRSDIGILYLDNFNARVLQMAFADARESSEVKVLPAGLVYLSTAP